MKGKKIWENTSEHFWIFGLLRKSASSLVFNDDVPYSSSYTSYKQAQFISK